MIHTININKYSTVWIVTNNLCINEMHRVRGEYFEFFLLVCPLFLEHNCIKFILFISDYYYYYYFHRSFYI